MIDHKDPKTKKVASTKFTLATDELYAANCLIEEEHYKESIIHLYFCSFYLSNAVCADIVGDNTNHRRVETELNKRYGRGNGQISASYVKLHNRLHELRNDFSYKTAHIPRKDEIKSLRNKLQLYYKQVEQKLAKVTTFDIIYDLYRRNPDRVRDFSFDIYCPKTYSHHNRITFWQPPFYLKIFTPEKIIEKTRILLSSLRIRKSIDYVIGLNSRVNQYSSDHYLLLDFDSLDTDVESVLKEIGGVILKSGRGYHFIGNEIIVGEESWSKEMKRIGRIRILKDKIDKKHIEISIRRGYSTLRVTKSPAKPQVPVFYKAI